MRFFLILMLMLASLNVQARDSVLEQLGFNDSEEPLPVDEAFRFSAQMQDAETLELRWNIADGNYLYRDKIAVSTASSAIKLGDYELPQGTEKDDAFFGLTRVLTEDILLNIPLQRPADMQQITLDVSYQGCSETFNICYPPETQQVTLDLPDLPSSASAGDTEKSDNAETAAAQAKLPEERGETSAMSRLMAEDNTLRILLGFLGLGLLLAFTPCVFPMIPILSSIIVGEGESVTTRRAFWLSLVYVLAMSVTYTIAGVLTGLLGGNLQAWLQNFWVIGFFSLILLALALAMFGFYELQLPQSVQQRLHLISRKQQGGKFISVALMGLLSGLIVGPCLAPPLAGALLFISQHADPVLGGAALFSLSIGMGIPLLIIGSSAGALLPRAGAWMQSIQTIFGVMLIALAIWMLSRVIPAALNLALWGSLLMICSVYLISLTPPGMASSGWQKFFKGVGYVALVYGALLLIGAGSGGKQLTQPLAGLNFAAADTAAEQQLTYTPVTSMAELQQQLEQSNRPVMLDFYADWCTDCKSMEQTTFKDPDVIAELKKYQVLKVDLTDNREEQQTILKTLKVFGPPTFIFYNKNGQEVANSRLIGHISAAEMQRHLQSLED